MLHRIISVENSKKEWCFKISNISKEYYIQASNKMERDAWVSAIHKNTESKFLSERYFSIEGPLISEEGRRSYHLLLGHNYVCANEEIRGQNSTYSL